MHRSTAGTIPLSRPGKVWSLITGPYGRTFALVWAPGNDASLVDIAAPDAGGWVLPGSADMWPHDAALGAAPLALTGVGDRLLALYVAPLCEEGCGPMRKYVFVPPAFSPPPPGAPTPARGAASAVTAAAARPVLAHLHVGGAAAAAAAAEAAAAGGAGGAAMVESSSDAAALAQEAAALEEEAERQVEEAEAAEDEAEADALAQPATEQQLRKQVEQLRAQLAQYQSGTGAGGEAYTSVHLGANGGSTGGRGGGGIGGAAAVAAVSVALGVLVGVAAARALGRRGSGAGAGNNAPRGSSFAELHQQQQRRGFKLGNSSDDAARRSLDDVLRTGEDLEAMREGDRLLARADGLIAGGIPSSAAR